MQLTRFNPRRDTELSSLRSQVDRLFDDFFAPVPFRDQDLATLVPAVDVEEDNDAYVFKIDLPGVDPKDAKITIHGDTLTIRGERKREETKKDNGSVHRYERIYGMFERSFVLGQLVKGDQVQATYKNGVLEIRVPKAEEAKQREIEVQVQ